MTEQPQHTDDRAQSPASTPDPSTTDASTTDRGTSSDESGNRGVASNPDKVRLGIIGAGQQGGAYVRMIADEGKVDHMVIGAICDIDQSKKQVADRLGVPFFTDHQQMLDSGDVDAVVTTVPHYLHPQLAMDSISAGIPVLIEKPAGVYTKQVDEMFAFADEHADVPFGIMFNQRTNPLYVDLKKLIDSGELGAVRHTSWIITTWWRPAQYYKQSEWRATWGGEGGGVLVNQAPHQLDLWQWLIGRPKRCFARLGFGYRRDIATESEVNAVVDFGDDCSGTFTTSTHDLAGTDRLEILFDQGKVVVDNSRKVTITRLVRPEQEISQELTWADATKLLSGGQVPEEFAQTETKDYSSVWGGQHVIVLENFAQHILDGTPLIADGHEGRNGVLLANAMQLSAWTDRDIDMVDFPADEYLAELNKHIEQEGKFPTRS